MEQNSQPDNISKNKNNRRNKLIGILCIAAFTAILVVVFIFVGEPMIKFAKEPEHFREWVDNLGVWGRLAFIGMIALQIIVAVIPGEPLEIVAGYAFGVFEGTLLCMLGSLAGGLIVFLFVRYFGTKVVDIFIPHEKITQLKFLNTKKKLTLLTTIVFLIPGTPKDVLTYFVGLTPMKLTTWMLITSLARFPSIITSTMGGNALGTKEYIAAVIIFAVTIIFSAAGLLIYKKLSAKKHASQNEEKQRSSSESLTSGPESRLQDNLPGSANSRGQDQSAALEDSVKAYQIPLKAKSLEEEEEKTPKIPGAPSEMPEEQEKITVDQHKESN